MQPLATVAVIGAGIAGIACAAALLNKHINVKVFDKGRGLGGRMATRRVDPWQWDHGVQYMTADDPVFSELLEALPVWHGAGSSAWKVGVPAQNQVVKNLARGMDVSLETRIDKLIRTDDGRWVLQADKPLPNERFDFVAVAVPAPQARALLPQTAAFAELAQVHINPCWALMLATPELVDMPDTIAAPHEHIAWLAADHSKPGRPAAGGQYVLHATADWSARHLESPNDDVKSKMLGFFQTVAGPIDISYAVAHRWRYALTERPLARPCLLDAANRIGVCGDWCLGARVEHGFLSGTALGERIAGQFTA